MSSKSLVRLPTILTLSMVAKVLTRPTAFGACAVVENPEGRVLLVRHSYMAGWGLPGGGVGHGEPPEDALLRELREEVGLQQSDPPEFLSLHTRKVAWFTNVVALYRLRNVRIVFRPNLEVREAMFCDPALLPDGTTAATRRRLAELAGKALRDPYW